MAKQGSIPVSSVTVDLVLLTIRQNNLCALVVRRGIEPFLNQWALPGGFVLPGETLDEGAARELAEETGLDNLPVHLEQLRSYGDPGRDPRARVVTVAYLALGPDLAEPMAGSDAAAAKWAPVANLLRRPGRLAFDHATILRDGVERARDKLEYSSLATHFCSDEFTVNELRRVYEIVWDVTLDPRNFHRKVTSAEGFLEPTGETTNRQGGRPAQLFLAGGANLLLPPILRPRPQHPTGSRA